MTARGARFKLAFFDSEAVIKGVGRANARVLGQFGRLARKRALKSIPYGDGPSSAGSPPHAHKSRKRSRTSKSTGKTRTRSVSFLREFLFYQYDKATQSVVVGPERLATTIDPDALPALEYGGSATIRVKGGGTRKASIAARPWMTPAFEAEKPSLPALWRDAVK